jgi:hypothetical protein
MNPEYDTIPATHDVQGLCFVSQELEPRKPNLTVAATILDAPEVGNERGGIGRRRHVSRDHILGRSIQADLTAIDPDSTRAEVLDSSHVVGDKHNRPATASHILHGADALLLERCVPNRQYFIDQEQVRLEVRGDSKTKPQKHSRRVTLHRGVEEPFDSGKGHDRVQFCLDLLPPHAENRAVQEDVLAAGQIAVKASSHL